MTALKRVYQVIYISRMAPDLAPTGLPGILAVSRTRNREQRINGALLFDGEFFGQCLQGEEAAVEAVMTRIAADTRHCEMEVLARGWIDERSDVLFANWRAGWAPTDSVALLADAEDVAHDFKQLLAHCDLA